MLSMGWSLQVPRFLVRFDKVCKQRLGRRTERGDYLPEREFYVCTVRHRSQWKLWAGRRGEWRHNRSRSGREVHDQLTHPPTSPAKHRVLAIEAALCGLNRFPEVRDPAEAATPGVCGRDYLNSRVAFRQMLGTARFTQ